MKGNFHTKKNMLQIHSLNKLRIRWPAIWRNWATTRKTGCSKRTCKAAGLPRILVHDLRHAHATVLLLRGVDPNIVRERLGHSSIKITYDIYAHHMPEHQKQAVDVIADVFGGGKENCQEVVQNIREQKLAK